MMRDVFVTDIVLNNDFRIINTIKRYSIILIKEKKDGDGEKGSI